MHYTQYRKIRTKISLLLCNTHTHTHTQSFDVKPIGHKLHNFFLSPSSHNTPLVTIFSNTLLYVIMRAPAAFVSTACAHVIYNIKQI